MPLGDRPVAYFLLVALVTGLVARPDRPAASAQAMNESESESETADANGQRLRSMPLEERRALSEKLKEFDALGRSERDAIRALDARIAELSPADRANYWSVLRRYHQWVRGLSDAQRNELNATSPAGRMALVTRFRGEERSRSETNTTPLFVQIADFTGMSPFESAQRLRAWFDLTPAARAEIEKLPSLADQQARFAEISQHAKGGQMNKISKEEEDALQAKIDANPQLKSWLANPLKKADPTKHEKAKRRLVINYYFVEHPPAPVESRHLLRFESALPTWFRTQFDHLPPDEARRRLTILYRLVFPPPGEMPEAPGTSKAPNAVVPKEAH